MQTRPTCSPQIEADQDSGDQLGANAQPSAQAHGTDVANPPGAMGRIELRTVYRLSLFAAGTAGE